MCFYHDTVLVLEGCHLLSILAPFHLRLIYTSLYQVLQIFDKGLFISAKILCHVTSTLTYQNSIPNLHITISMSSFLTISYPTPLHIFVLPSQSLLSIAVS